MQGPIGGPGPQGRLGDVGPQGVQGPAGEVGPEGPAGQVGPQGQAGDVGAQGPPGPQGIAGNEGAQGLRGEIGPEGDQGPDGVQVVTAQVTDDGDLVIGLSSGDQIQAGPVVGPAGDDAESCRISTLRVDDQEIAGAIVLTCGQQAPVRLHAFLCGNGQINGAETCDDGNFAVGDGCDATCALECGNSRLDPNEECDDGNQADNDACTSECVNARCGDGIVYTGVEACDGTPGCRDDCTLQPCAAAGVCDDFDFVPIPGGVFQMGYADGLASELPVHEVNVPDFELLRGEVTVAQYGRCVTAGVCSEPPEGLGYNWGAAGRSEHPVNGVSWLQARTYAAWAGARLPSEAEWEFAARSRGQDIRFPWGNEEPDCERTHNYTCEGSETAVICTHPDGDSTEGICDLTGNIWEWVEDQYHRTYEDAPNDGSPWCDQADCADESAVRVWRGGDYKSDINRMRSSARGYYGANVQFQWMGFRLAR